MPTLLTLLESTGIHIALAIGAVRTGSGSRPTKELLHEVITGRAMVLLVGGLIIGFLIGDKNWKVIEPFYDTKGAIFRGALCIFMLEMGLLAGARLGDLKKVGPFLLGFGMIMPLLHGALGTWLGGLAGLSVGGATMLGAMAASASSIAGRGEGSRHAHATDLPGANVRIEAIVRPEVADRIMEHVSAQYFTHYSFIAYVVDVAVARVAKYG